MKLQKLEITPKNPRHFLSLLFIKCRENPSIKERNDYLVLLEDLGSKALFKSAYGSFWVKKDQTVLSKSFL